MSKFNETKLKLKLKWLIWKNWLNKYHRDGIFKSSCLKRFCSSFYLSIVFPYCRLRSNWNHSRFLHFGARCSSAFVAWCQFLREFSLHSKLRHDIFEMDYWIPSMYSRRSMDHWIFANSNQKALKWNLKLSIIKAL